ncbi:MAG: MFS transporter [Pseudomonadota bacterium]
MTDATPHAQSTSSSLAPIYVASMVCSMGMMGFVAASGPLAVSLSLEAWQIGLSAMAGGLGWVLSARYWGRTADKVGRKPVLLGGLTGFILGYAVLCLGVLAGQHWNLAAPAVLTILIVSRFGMGLSYSAVPAAGAAVIADRFTADERSGAMGRLGAAQASGLLLGPGAVALLAGSSPSMVLVILALLPIFALGFILARLPNDMPRADATAKHLALSDPRLIRAVLSAVLAMIAVGIAQIVIGFVAMDRLSLPENAALLLAGSALTAVGISLIVAQLVVKSLGWHPTTLIRVGSGIAALGCLAAAVAPTPFSLVLSYALAGFGAGWAFPGINAYAANSVSREEQGRAAGAVSSAMGLGAMLGPLLGGFAYQLSEMLPLLIAAVAFTVAIWIPRSSA